MLNRSKTGLALIFWTGLDQVGWKLVFRTDFEELSLDYRRQIKPGQFYTAIHLTIWAVQNGPGMLNRNKTGLTLLFWTGLDLVRWKLVFRTDFEKLSLDYRRQIKPGQFYTAIHLTIWAVQNGPGMLNRNKTGLSLIFWTGMDLVRWKLVFRTDFENHSLDYRRKLKPGQSARPYCAEWSAHVEWSGHQKSYLNGNRVPVLDCFGPNSTQTRI